MKCIVLLCAHGTFHVPKNAKVRVPCVFFKESRIISGCILFDTTHTRCYTHTCAYFRVPV